jgi:transcriptional regulator with XRE-family HTH domain
MSGVGVVLSGIRELVFVPQLRRLRLLAALSQADLAARAGVSAVTVMRGEQGKPIRPSSVRKLARALRVRPRDLQ